MVCGIVIIATLLFCAVEIGLVIGGFAIISTSAPIIIKTMFRDNPNKTPIITSVPSYCPIGNRALSETFAPLRRRLVGKRLFTTLPLLGGGVGHPTVIETTSEFSVR
jgi:hypothetical protein